MRTNLIKGIFLLITTFPELSMDINAAVQRYRTYSVKVLHHMFRVLVVVFTPVDF